VTFWTDPIEGMVAAGVAALWAEPKLKAMLAAALN
jgi:hypothetical protein